MTRVENASKRPRSLKPYDPDGVPIRLEVYKEGSYFIGNLIWSCGNVWMCWQKFKRLGDLKENARCFFDGPIVRI